MYNCSDVILTYKHFISSKCFCIIRKRNNRTCCSSHGSFNVNITQHHLSVSQWSYSGCQTSNSMSSFSPLGLACLACGASVSSGCLNRLILPSYSMIIGIHRLDWNIFLGLWPKYFQGGTSPIWLSAANISTTFIDI